MQEVPDQGHWQTLLWSATLSRKARRSTVILTNQKRSEEEPQGVLYKPRFQAWGARGPGPTRPGHSDKREGRALGMKRAGLLEVRC